MRTGARDARARTFEQNVSVPHLVIELPITNDREGPNSGDHHAKVDHNIALWPGRHFGGDCADGWFAKSAAPPSASQDKQCCAEHGRPPQRAPISASEKDLMDPHDPSHQENAALDDDQRIARLLICFSKDVAACCEGLRCYACFMWLGARSTCAQASELCVVLPPARLRDKRSPSGSIQSRAPQKAENAAQDQKNTNRNSRISEMACAATDNWRLWRNLSSNRRSAGRFLFVMFAH